MSRTAVSSLPQTMASGAFAPSSALRRAFRFSGSHVRVVTPEESPQRAISPETPKRRLRQFVLGPRPRDGMR